MLKGFAFDLGNVVINFDYSLAIEKIRDKLTIPAEDFVDTVLGEEFIPELEKGLITGPEFYSRCRSFFKVDIDYIGFKELWCGIFWPNSPVIGLIRELKLSYPLYLISNISEIHFDYLYGKFREVLDLFDRLILSYRVKSIKPEPGIYNHLLSVSGLNAPEIVYIDDRRDLVDKAAELRFKSVWFRGYEPLLADLSGLGVRN